MTYKEAMVNNESGTSRRRYNPVGWFALGFAVLAGPSPVLAQTTVAVVSEASAAEMVECFRLIEARRERGAPVTTSPCPEGVVGAHGVMADPDQYAPQLVQEVLDEMTSLATTTQSDFIRSVTVSWIANPGRRDAGFERPAPGVVDRLQSVYQVAETYLTRRVIVEAMGRQREQSKAAGFLEAVVREAELDSHAEPIPEVAAKSLARLGPIGEERLHQLRLERTP